MDAELAANVAISGAALALGGFLCCFAGVVKTAGKLTVFFGAQTGMNLYMKAVLSSAVVSESPGMRGIPAAFLVTALQQLTSFVACVCFLLATHATPWVLGWRYTPKQLAGKWEVASVCCLALAFGLNVGLNNFSLSLLAVSVNLLIRSCLPLSTFVMQVLLGRYMGDRSAAIRNNEVAFMVIGTFFAALAVFAKAQASSRSMESEHFKLGVIICILSTVSGSVTLVVAGMLGTTVALNPLDTTYYVSVPCMLVLLPPIFAVRHPVSWQGTGPMNDWEIFLTVMDLHPEIMGLVLLSGLLAFAYNLLQYTVIQTLSATHTAFAGNFNKAATVVMALLTGLEELPVGTWGFVMLAAVLGNIGAFTAYSVARPTADAPLLHRRSEGMEMHSTTSM